MVSTLLHPLTRVSMHPMHFLPQAPTVIQSCAPATSSPSLQTCWRSTAAARAPNTCYHTTTAACTPRASDYRRCRWHPKAAEDTADSAMTPTCGKDASGVGRPTRCRTVYWPFFVIVAGSLMLFNIVCKDGVYGSVNLAANGRTRRRHVMATPDGGIVDGGACPGPTLRETWWRTLARPRHQRRWQRRLWTRSRGRMRILQRPLPGWHPPRRRHNGTNNRG